MVASNPAVDFVKPEISGWRVADHGVGADKAAEPVAEGGA